MMTFDDYGRDFNYLCTRLHQCYFTSIDKTNLVRVVDWDTSSEEIHVKVYKPSLKKFGEGVVTVKPETLDYSPFKIGNFDYGGSSYYSSLVPARQWFQGVSFRIVRVFPHPPLSNTNNNLLDVATGQSFSNKYTPLKEALDKVQDAFESVSLDRLFSVDETQSLRFKNFRVGILNSENAKLTLFEPFKYLTEVCEEKGYEIV